MILFYSLVFHMVKNLPAMQETQLQSLGQEDSPKKEMATHSSMLAWEILWTEKPGRATVHGVEKESDATELLNNNKGIHVRRCRLWLSLRQRIQVSFVLLRLKF